MQQSFNSDAKKKGTLLAHESDASEPARDTFRRSTHQIAVFQSHRCQKVRWPLLQNRKPLQSFPLQASIAVKTTGVGNIREKTGTL